MVGRRRHNRRTWIGEQFSARTIRMLESPAYRVLSLSEHRCLARLEVELAHHGGADNGKLPCTYDDFERYGVHRRSIYPALRALEALGFIEITEQGRAGNAEWRRPTLFRLTYQPAVEAEPSNEWQRFETMEKAEAVASAARHPPKKQKSSGGKRTEVRGGNRTTNSPIHSAESATTCVSAESATTSIFRGGGGRRASINADGIRTFAILHNGSLLRVGAFAALRKRAARPSAAVLHRELA